MANPADRIDIMDVMQYLPHRYPFLLIDRVVEWVPGDYLVGIKNVTINEPYFQGHFPQRPIMPGVLIMEALAQATGILALATEGKKRDDDTLYYFAGIDNARFKRPVSPGDQLLLRVKLLRTKRGIWMFSGEAKVDGSVVASGDIMCTKRGINL